MDSKTLLFAISMMYIADCSNALMCYNCTQALEPACGEMLGDTSGLQKVTCPGICMTAKSSMEVGGNLMTMYARTCEGGCNAACMVFEGVNVCTNCCNTDLCNANFVASGAGGAGAGGAGGAGAGGAGAGGAGAGAEPEPTQPAAKDGMTTPSSATSVVVHFATLFFTGLLSTTML